MAMLISKRVILGNRRDESEAYRRISRSLVIPSHNLVLAAASELQVVAESRAVHLSYLDVSTRPGTKSFIYFPIEALYRR